MGLESAKGSAGLQVLAASFVALGLAGLVLSLNAQLTGNLETQLDYGATNTITNQSVTLTNASATRLIADWPVGRINTLTSVRNNSMTILTGNLTVVNASHVNTTFLAAGGTLVSGTYNVTYVEGRRTVAYYVATNATEGISQGAQQLDLIGLVIGLGAALGIIFVVFQLRKRF